LRHQVRLPFRAALLSSALLACLGQAQEGVFYEVISVTAQKRTQNLQEVGVSVSAFSEDQINALGWDNSLDVAAQTPGLVATSNTGDAGNIALFSIRGVSQLDFAEGQEAPIAVYQDEAYLSSPGASGTPAFDIERIEVLRGPQGTLYGRNATGGLVHFISNKPTDDFEAQAELTIAEFGQIGFNGAVSGALSDSVQGRLAVYHNKDDGYVKNVAGPDMRADDTQSVRAMVNVDFSADSSLLLTARYTTMDTRGGVFHTRASRIDENGLGVFCTPGETNCGPGPSDPASGAFSFFDVAAGQVDDGIGDELEGYFDRENSGVERDSSSFTATFTHTFNSGITMTSVTDFSESDKSYVEDDDSVQGTLVTYDSLADIEQYSQEVRFDGNWGEHKWIAGFYYLNIENDFAGAFQFPVQFTYFPRFDAQSETETYSLFGQVDYQLSDDLLLTAGLRWTRDDKDLRYTMTQCDVTSPLGLGFCPARLISDPDLAADPLSANSGFDGLLVDGLPHDFSRVDEEFSGKLQLDWQMNKDALLYAGVSRGVKGGGFNTPSDGFEVATLEAVGFDPEILWAYEAGVKSTWLDNSLRVNASVFYYDYENYQAFFFADTTSLLINSEAEFMGGELEVTYTTQSGWDFLFGLSLLDTEVNGQSGTTSIVDQQAPLAPEVSVNGLVRKFWELSNGGTLATQVSANYSGEQYFNVVNSETTEGGDVTLIDARISYTTADDLWEFSLFANNITDERPVNYSYDISGFGNYTIQTIGPPRWYGMNVQYRY